jgi:hypothetical protein
MLMKAVWKIVITVIHNVKILTNAIDKEMKHVMEQVHVHKILIKKEIANLNRVVLVIVINKFINKNYTINKVLFFRELKL